MGLKGENHHKITRSDGKLLSVDGKELCAADQIRQLKAPVKMRIKGPLPIAINIIGLAGNGVLRLMCQHGGSLLWAHFSCVL